MKGAVTDFVFVDVDRVEQRLVEQASLFVVAAPVQLARVLQQFEADLDEPGTVGQVFTRLGQSAVEPLSLLLDVSELGLDLRLRQRAVGSEVDEVLLLGVEHL